MKGSERRAARGRSGDGEGSGHRRQSHQLSRKALIKEQKAKLAQSAPAEAGAPETEEVDIVASEAPAQAKPRSEFDERQPSSNQSTILIEGGEDFDEEEGEEFDEENEPNFNRWKVHRSLQGSLQPAEPVLRLEQQSSPQPASPQWRWWQRSGSRQVVAARRNAFQTTASTSEARIFIRASFLWDGQGAMPVRGFELGNFRRWGKLFR